MLSEANREIRAEIDRQIERRFHRPVHSIAFAYLDELIAELEELHMRDRQYIPVAFDARLRTLENILPPELKRPRHWPVRIRRLLDECFDLQAQLLSRRPLKRSAVWASRGGRQPGARPRSLQ